MSRYTWFHHTDMINLFYQNLTFPLGVSSCLDMFSRKKIFMFCYSLLDSKVIGKRHLKFLSDIKELQINVLENYRTNPQNSMFVSLSGIVTVFFKDAIESIIKGCSNVNKSER